MRSRLRSLKVPSQGQKSLEDLAEEVSGTLWLTQRALGLDWSLSTYRRLPRSVLIITRALDKPGQKPRPRGSLATALIHTRQKQHFLQSGQTSSSR